MANLTSPFKDSLMLQFAPPILQKGAKSAAFSLSNGTL